MVSNNNSSITKGRKFKQVLEGARKVFLREGFAGASVDEIASEAQVSKATLYSYFPDKELMFNEVYRADIALEAEESVVVSTDQSVVDALPLVVHAIASRMVAETGISSYRMRIAESGRFPDLAREHMATSYRRSRDNIREFLERWVRRGELEIEDIELAVEQLIVLSSALVRDRAVFLGSASVTESHMRRTTAGAAHVFLAAYGPAYSGARGVTGEGPIRRGLDRSKTVPPME